MREFKASLLVSDVKNDDDLGRGLRAFYKHNPRVAVFQVSPKIELSGFLDDCFSSCSVFGVMDPYPPSSIRMFCGYL